MTQNDTDPGDRRRGSAWGDCAECGSPHTILGTADDNHRLICEDCRAVTDGIKKGSTL
jgi:hypothetical protein